MPCSNGDLRTLVRRQAAIRLAEHLRQAVRDLPSESPLALIFVEHASTFDAWARGRNPAAWTDVTLERLEQDLKSLLRAEDEWAQVDED
jgi:hypothetical protein